MSAMAFGGDAFRPQPAERVGRPLVLALLAHVLLVIVLAIGVNWRTSTEREGSEAELWAAVPQIAAPRAATQEPALPPPVQRPQPVPRAEPPPLRVTPEPDAQIAIDKARREERKQRKEQELAEQRAEKLEKDKADKLAAKQADAQKAKAERQLALQQEQAASAAATKKKELSAQMATQMATQKREAQREANLQRMLAQAGSGEAASPGREAQSAGPSADYIGRIKGRIRPNVAFPNTLAGNPAVEVELRLAADGRILSTRIVKPSGSREWDEAVQRGIEKTEMLPRDENGKAPPSMIIEYRPRD